MGSVPIFQHRNFYKITRVKMRVYLFLLLFCSLLSFNAHSQSTDTLSVKFLLKEISSLQSIHSDEFPDGGFPSYRKYSFSNAYKPDYNFFIQL